MAVNAVWLPHSMDAVVQIIKERRVAKHPFLHNLILRTIRELAESEGCTALSVMFASEVASDHFIDKMIDTHLAMAIHALKRSQRETMRAKVKVAKDKWIMKHNEHQHTELYLGRLKFEEELKRSCGEFYSSLKIV
jgi:hypothetical protein